MDSLKDQTAIVGIGWTEFSKSSGRTEWSMATEAAVKACADAGIAPNQIDGIVRSSFDAVLQHQLVKSLGIDELTYHGEVGFGGGAPCAVATQAAMAVATAMPTWANGPMSTKLRTRFTATQSDAIFTGVTVSSRAK